MRKGRDAVRAAAADFARDPHEVADNRHAGGMRSRAAPIVKRVLAEFASDPYGVIRAVNAGQDCRRGNERRANTQDETFADLAGGTQELDCMVQPLRVLKIYR